MLDRPLPQVLTYKGNFTFLHRVNHLIQFFFRCHVLHFTQVMLIKDHRHTGSLCKRCRDRATTPSDQRLSSEVTLHVTVGCWQGAWRTGT